MDSSRRLFLQHLSAFAPLGSAAPMALSMAASGALAAQDASDYKALVCIFMFGGNDSFNTVLATDSDSWRNYTGVRSSKSGNVGLLKDVQADRSKEAGSPEWMGGVLPISPQTAQAGRSFAFNPLLPDLQNLFNVQKRLAVVSNVGTLVEPLNRVQYIARSKAFPKKLFSHNDQQSEWQTFSPEGASTGWGGRIADLFAAGNGNSLFSTISVGDNSAWLAGQHVKQYRLGAGGAIRVGTSPDAQGLARTYGSDVVAAALERIVRTPRTGHVMEADYAAIAGKAIDAERQLSGVLPDAAVAPYGPAQRLNYSPVTGGSTLNPLASQLQMVARMIASQAKLGIKRQVFFVNLNGFDTHDGQSQRHGNLMGQLNHGLKYFDTVINAMGMGNQVTTFTASDFGRTFTCNGDGTDHGWGGHHFVMGGAVAGGDICGAFPVYGAKASTSNDILGSDDQIYCGVLVPKLALDQYGAALAKWFGVTDSGLTDIFPNLGNFASRANIGLMKA
ncbi:MAG: DUF1501 domain-containing protein [Aquabacterium sp.]